MLLIFLVFLLNNERKSLLYHYAFCGGVRSPFQFPNYLMDFHKTYCEWFDLRGYPKTVINNFQERVITILRTR